ncbi:hypothetical protein PG995_012579 [Apiospora arundinis]
MSNPGDPEPARLVWVRSPMASDQMIVDVNFFQVSWLGISHVTKLGIGLRDARVRKPKTEVKEMPDWSRPLTSASAMSGFVQTRRPTRVPAPVSTSMQPPPLPDPPVQNSYLSPAWSPGISVKTNADKRRIENLRKCEVTTSTMHLNY